MENYWVSAATALWLGVLTSISPCPLATNIVAVSFVSQRAANPARALLTGLMYTLGRMLAYVAVGMIVVWSLLSIPQVSNSLQKYMSMAIGPMLIVMAPFIAGVIRFGNSGSSWTTRLSERSAGWGLWGAALMGVIFALTFCPVSAALFFGSLIPLAVQAESNIIMPSFYGVGTALPVLLCALLIASGMHAVGRAFRRLTEFDRYARWVTAGVFLLAGIYLIVRR